jgi:hypothetical protein
MEDCGGWSGVDKNEKGPERYYRGDPGPGVLRGLGSHSPHRAMFLDEGFCAFL